MLMTFIDAEENISRKEAATVLPEATTHSSAHFLPDVRFG